MLLLLRVTSGGGSAPGNPGPGPSVIFVASVMGCSTANAEMTTAPQFKATAVTDLHHSATAPANSRRNTRNGFLIN